MDQMFTLNPKLRTSGFLCTTQHTASQGKGGKGELSRRAYLRHGKSKKKGCIRRTTYKIKLWVEPDFGTPGAFLIANRHKHKFFLESVTVEVVGQQKHIHFDCSSWIYPIDKTKSERLFFSNTSYLPNQTPPALVELRKLELLGLRGDGTGERKEWDRIYDYDLYNDLGDPDKGWLHARPVIGGCRWHQYPRRGRTGRPPTNTDPLAESHAKSSIMDIYVPSDEQFSPTKLSDFVSNSIEATVHFLVSEAKALLKKNDSSNFKSFDDLRELFSGKRTKAVEKHVREKLKKLVPEHLLIEITNRSKEEVAKFPLPQIIADNDVAWMDDMEFARQMLAGVNPARIQCLQEFPPKGKHSVSTIKASDIGNNLDGLNLVEAMEQWRIFILDHHDYLIPFLSRINAEGVCAYATRTLLFLRSDSTLKPLVIELSLPGISRGATKSRIILPARQGTEAALWQLAKAHVMANDSAYHQLVSHWLHTHAVIEPFIIASRRQLSALHPIHRLLHPHFKDTMHINALARNFLINSGGILENTLFTGEISMELSSELYKQWRFDEQALPADLLKRRLALPDPDSPSGVELLFPDYPYAADGLDIWNAIKTWVTDFCSLFYKDDISITSDVEIQAWWSEIRNVGHGDKSQEKWWYKMTTISDLIEALTTLIWIASALHASLNYGQYAYAGYPPNRPTLCRKFIPKEGTRTFAEFLGDPDKFYLEMLPERLQMTLGLALTEVLSRHISDEVYLGQRPINWTDNKEVEDKFRKFNDTLQEIEAKIIERNRNPELQNRSGPSKIPYKLLYPGTSNTGSKGCFGTTGIPNSISL
ncbi:Linoleate 9S-lipoxygenase 6 (Fragment) [Linum perenne]